MKIQYTDTDGIKGSLPEGYLGYDKATADRGRVAVGTNTGDVPLAKKSEVDSIVNGTTLVDGRNLSVDGTKLDTIETGATADQSASEIKTAYESNNNTNALTDSLLTLLTTKKVKNVSTDTINDKLVITYTDNTVSNLNINDIVTDVHVSGASLDATSNVLTLTSADGGANVTVDLSSFVNSSELTTALTNHYTKNESNIKFEPKNANIQSHISSTSNPHGVTKAQVGLGNVDNTSDVSKPVSIATQSALNLKANDNTVVKLTGNQTIAGVKTFSSNIVGNVSGNATTATKLQTARTINGVAFDGSANIAIGSLESADTVKLTGNQTIAGTKTFSSNIVGNITGNSGTATKLQTARTITLSGDVSGSTSFDGSGNVSISVAVADDSHNHSFANLTSAPTTATRWPTWSEVSSKPSSFTPSAHTHPASQITGLGTAASRNVGNAVGNVMEVGAFGLGDVMASGSSTVNATGFYYSPVSSSANGGGSFFMDVKYAGGGTDTYQAFRLSNVPYTNSFYLHSGKGGGALGLNPPIELHHTDNLLQTTGTSTTYPMSQKATTDALNTKAPSAHTHPWSQVTGQPTTATRWPTFAEVTGKPIVQTTGTSTTDLMSQKSVTDAITAGDNTKLTKTNPSITGSVTEQVYNLTGTSINPSNGTIQYKTVSANTTFTESLASGQSVLLRLINANSYTITFPIITWVGAAAPELTANCAIVLWKEQSTLYGAFVGTLV